MMLIPANLSPPVTEFQLCSHPSLSAESMHGFGIAGVLFE
jgi:hypothetical protein